ncbi:MAG: GDSL family lipase [Oscillospiraceae bacterium]|nr:GDSL family lipase [Oscillospiraceae bacterium]
MFDFKAEEGTVRILGRTLFRDEVRWLGYACTGIDFEFTGNNISVQLTTDWENDAEWKHIFQPYMAVYINGNAEPSKRFPVENGTNCYSIYSSDKSETVRITLLKLSENAFSKVGIASISADGKIKPAAPVSERRIEFIGDSITCGFGIEAESADEGFRTATENSRINYASLTARHFNSEYNLTSWTSIGVYSNSVKPDVNEPDDGWTMPKIYFYTDKATDGWLGNGEDKLEMWDFSRFAPQLIVVNLGTNDKDFTRGIKERTDAFKEAYVRFISDVRNANPNSYILCTLGTMGQELCLQIEEAVSILNDEKISFMPFEVQLESDGIGAEMHPNKVTHRKMADKLINEIERLVENGQLTF